MNMNTEILPEVYFCHIFRDAGFTLVKKINNIQTSCSGKERSKKEKNWFYEPKPKFKHTSCKRQAVCFKNTHEMLHIYKPKYSRDEIRDGTCVH